jgi:hypothetical protein
MPWFRPIPIALALAARSPVSPGGRPERELCTLVTGERAGHGASAR